MKDAFHYLDQEEKEIMESVERGEWKRVANFEEEKKKAESAAKATLTVNCLMMTSSFGMKTSKLLESRF